MTFVSESLEPRPCAVLPDPWRADPDQEFDSRGTSVRIVPRVMRSIPFQPGTLNADIGGGRFDDATRFLDSLDVENVVFDPFNRSRIHNQRAATLLCDGKAATATVCNVLNVIACPVARDRVVAIAADAVGGDGTAWFQVYEGNRTGQPGATSRGWQENRRLATYVDEVRVHFRDVTVVKGAIRASGRIDGPWRSGSRRFATLEQVRAARCSGPFRRWDQKVCQSPHSKAA